MGAAIGELLGDGWEVEWHNDESAILTKGKKTPGRAFARGGLIGMAINERKKPQRMRLTATSDGIKREAL